jgi:hypothetical protein
MRLRTNPINVVVTIFSPDIISDKASLNFLRGQGRKTWFNSKFES